MAPHWSPGSTGHRFRFIEGAKRAVPLAVPLSANVPPRTGSIVAEATRACVDDRLALGHPVFVHPVARVLVMLPYHALAFPL